MKKIFILSLLAIFLGTFSASAQKVKANEEYRYELVSMGVGSQGTDLIKVFSYVKKEKDATELAKRNAVHGVLFKGVAGTSGTASQPPLVKPLEKENHEDFFEAFFKNGTYQRYVTLSSDGTVDPKDRMKVGKEYKIGIIVSVNKDDLRKYLESEGITKGLGSFF
jgi:hypothetical protein